VHKSESLRSLFIYRIITMFKMNKNLLITLGLFSIGILLFASSFTVSEPQTISNLEHMPIAPNDHEMVNGTMHMTQERAILFSETTNGYQVGGSFGVWDESTLEVNSTFSASEGKEALRFNAGPADGWWGFAYSVGGVDLSNATGFMVFDMNTTYAGDISLGFQTGSTYNVNHRDFRVTLENGKDFVNDSTWQTLVVPLKSFAQAGGVGVLNFSDVSNAFFMTQEGTALGGSIYVDNIYWSMAHPLPDVGDKRAVMFADNLSGDKTVGVTPQVWDDSSLSVIDTSNATFSAYDAKEGNNVLQFNPNPAGGWWGFALAAGNADLSGHDGFMIFDMNTTYAGNISLGFQTVSGGATDDFRFELLHGQDFVSDGTWQTIIMPISNFMHTNGNGGLNTSNVLSGMFMTQGSGNMSSDSIYIDRVHWANLDVTKGFGDNVAIVYSETTTGTQINGSFGAWDESTIVGNYNGSASEGNQSVQFNASAVGYWWGMAYAALGGADLSTSAGFMVFDIKTSYSGNISLGFQTGTTYNVNHKDFRFDLEVGKSFVNDSTWQTVIVPISMFMPADGPGALNFSDVSNAFFITQSGAALTDTIYLDNIYWVDNLYQVAMPQPPMPPGPVTPGPEPQQYVYSSANDAKLYSETNGGTQVAGEVFQWNNAGDMTLTTTTDASEGTEAIHVTATPSVEFWWGAAFGDADGSGDLYDLSAFEGGYLVLDIKANYNGTFSVGFQEGAYPANNDAMVALTDGTYGYANDGEWHTVVIPFADLMAASTFANTSVITTPFALFDDNSANDGFTGNGDIYFDNVYYTMVNPVDTSTETSTSTDTSATNSTTSETSTSVPATTIANTTLPTELPSEVEGLPFNAFYALLGLSLVSVIGLRRRS